MQAIDIVNQKTGNKYLSLRLLAPLTLISCGVSLAMSGIQFSDLRDELAHHGKWAPVLFMLCGVAATLHKENNFGAFSAMKIYINLLFSTALFRISNLSL